MGCGAHIGENFLVAGSSMDVRTSRRSTETAPTVTAGHL